MTLLRGGPRLGGAVRVLTLLLVWVAAGAAWGEDASGDPASAELVEVDAVPAVAAFGVQFGFPAYRTEVDFRWDGCRWLRTALRY